MNDFISTIRLALNEYFHGYHSVSLLIHSVSVIFTPIRYSYVPGNLSGSVKITNRTPQKGNGIVAKRNDICGNIIIGLLYYFVASLIVDMKSFVYMLESIVNRAECQKLSIYCFPPATGTTGTGSYRD